MWKKKNSYPCCILTLAKLQSAKGASHHLTLMDKCLTDLSYLSGDNFIFPIFLGGSGNFSGTNEILWWC